MKRIILIISLALVALMVSSRTAADNGKPSSRSCSSWLAVDAGARHPLADCPSRAGLAGLLRSVRDRSGPGAFAECLHPGDRSRANLAHSLIGPPGYLGSGQPRSAFDKLERAHHHP